jgi:hypothetical protein
MVVMSIVSAVLARVVVEDIDQALPIYEALSGADGVRRFQFGDVELAWVGNFLLLSGAPDSLANYQRVATLIVSDMAAAVAVVRENAGTVLEGPGDAPNGPRMIARHGDGDVFEYIEPRQS